MPEKDPTNYSALTYLWVFLLSSWGGLVSFFRKYKEGKTRAFNIVEFIGEIVISAFVGVVTFLLCEAGNINHLVSAALVAISGHMGSRAIFIFERYAEKWAETHIKPITTGDNNDTQEK